MRVDNDLSLQTPCYHWGGTDRVTTIAQHVNRRRDLLERSYQVWPDADGGYYETPEFTEAEIEEELADYRETLERREAAGVPIHPRVD